MSSARAGTLYLVSTPIGNLGDMTHRAVEVLSSAALIIAEDTRHSRRLLDHYKISTPLKSYHEHNEAQVPIPGASSVMAAIVGSGMPLERFTFVGFLPRKGRERSEMIADIVASHSTVVMFEAANRVGATLGALAAAGAGDRPAVVARELTKQFEEFKRGSVSELAAVYTEVDPKGEVVLVIAGAEKSTVSEGELSDAARKLRASGNSPRDVMEHLMSGLGAPRNVAYKLAHESES